MKNLIIQQKNILSKMRQVLSQLSVLIGLLNIAISPAMGQFNGFGNGNDGALTVESSEIYYANENCAKIQLVNSGNSIITITTSPIPGFAEDDLILIIDMLSCASQTNWEFNRIIEIDGLNITLEYELQHDYSSAQIIQVKEYSDVTVNAEGIITCSEWNPDDGTGGVLPLMVNGTLTINGIIDATAKGFAPGDAGTGGSGAGGYPGAAPGEHATPAMGGQGIGSAGNGGKTISAGDFGDLPENLEDVVCGWSLESNAQNKSEINFPATVRLLMGASGRSGEGGQGGGGGGGAGGDATDCNTNPQNGGNGNDGVCGEGGGIAGRGGGVILIKAIGISVGDGGSIKSDGSHGEQGGLGGDGGSGGEPTIGMGAGAGNGGNGGNGGKGAGGGAGGAIYIVSPPGQGITSSHVSLTGGNGGDGGNGGSGGSRGSNAGLDYIQNGCPCPLSKCACEEVWEFMNGAVCSQLGDYEWLYEKVGDCSCIVELDNGWFKIVCTDLSSNPPCQYECEMEQISPVHPGIFATECLSVLCENIGSVPDNFGECILTCDNIYTFKNVCCQGEPPILIKRIEPSDGEPGEDGPPGENGEDGKFGSGCEIIIECPEDLSLTCPIDFPYELPDGDPPGGTYEGDGIEQQAGWFNFNSDCDNIPVGELQDFEITYSYTDPETGCSGSCSFTITVENPEIGPVVCPEDRILCCSKGPYLLSTDQYLIGTFSGPYVNLNNNGLYEFDPVCDDLGDFEVTYNYPDQANPYFTCTFTITVEGNLTPSCPHFELEVCITDEPFWMGDIYVDPAALGAGVHYFSCTITNSCGPFTSWNPEIKHKVTVYEPGTYVCPNLSLCHNAAPRYHCGVWVDPSTLCNPFWMTCSENIEFENYITPCGETISGSFTATVYYCCEPFPYPYVFEEVEWTIASLPFQPYPPDIEIVFEPAIYLNQLEVVLGKEGIFWPSGSINTLGNWDVYQGYKIKVNSPMAIWSIGAIPEDKTINLNAGANYIPVLSPEFYPAMDIFTQLGDGLIFAYDLNTELLYWPQGGIYMLEVLEPGKGYLVGMTQPGQATYDPPLKGGVKNHTPARPKVYEDAPWQLVKSGETHFISITTQMLEALEPGDFIGVFNAEGVCAGLSKYEDKSANLLLVAYGNDFTEKAGSGLAENENMSFRIFRTSSQTEAEVSVTFDLSMPNTGNYATNGMSKITGIKTGATSIAESELTGIHIYPNPSNDIFNITGYDGIVSLKVYDVFGKDIFNNTVNLPSEVDLSMQPKSIYLIIIKTEHQTLFEKLILY
jgi:hypothetical protein